MAGERVPAREETVWSTIQLQLLGGFRAERDGIPVPDAAWGRPKARTLVKLLAVEPSHQLHREQLLELLWPDLNPDSALASFRKTLHRARQALDPGRRGADSCLQLNGDALALDRQRVAVDVDRFEVLAQSALAGEDVAAYEEALQAYSGELLPEDRYEDWASSRRESLADVSLRLLIRLAQLLEQRGEYAAAVERLETVLRHDPVREDVHRELMRIQIALGNRRQALRQYDLCRAVLADELGVDPEPETTALYEAIAAGRLSAAPPHETRREEEQVPLPAAVRRLPEGELVGRERPLQLLAADLAGMVGRRETAGPRAQRPIVLIGGEAGIGKTRLAVELARRAHEEGLLVLWGDSYQHDGTAPYVPLIEALEGYLATRSEQERQRIASSYPELVPLLPRLGASSHATVTQLEQGSEEAGRLRLFNALVRFLSELAEQHPILLVFDDLHLADPATLLVVQHLARAAHQHLWLLLATYREEDVLPGGPFDTLRLSLSRASLGRHIDLLRLSRAECAGLVASLLPEGSVDEELIERIYALSLGNPFFAAELIETMREGSLTLEEGRWAMTEQEIAIPRKVRDVIAARTARLPEGAQQVVMLAATAGMESQYDVLREASALEDGVLLDGLDAALGAHILEEQEERFVFHHPLIRETVYERVSRVRRLHLHRRVAEALQTLRPDGVAAIAHHYERAEAAEAAEWLERAGDRAASIYATDAAVAAYQSAQKRLRPGDLQGQARLHEKLGRVLLSAGQYDKALEVLERAVALQQQVGDVEAAGRITADIGIAHRWRGTPEEGIARVEPMIELLRESGPSPSLASLQLAFAHLLMLVGRYGEMLQQAEEAGVLARAVDGHALLAAAEERRGAALLLLGRPDEGQCVIESALPLIEATGDLDLLRRALYNAACGAAYAGRIDEERAYGERALEVAERVGNPDQIIFVLGGLANATYLLGDWQAARRYLDRAMVLAGSVQRNTNLAAMMHTRATLDIAEGNWEDGARFLQEALRQAEEMGNRQAAEQAHGDLASLDLLMGRTEAAIVRLQPLVVHEDVDLLVLGTLADAVLQAGDVARGRILADQTLARARAEEPLQLSDALIIHGKVLAQEDRPDEAFAAFDEAMEHARSMQVPYVQARVLYQKGLLASQHGEPDDVRSLLQEALAIFQRLGAKKDIERTQRALAGMSRFAPA